MQIHFHDNDPKSIIAKIKDVMGDRQLGKMVTFDLSGNEMIVTISKLGTSSLHFTCSKVTDGCDFELTKEKIALAHKPLKGEVTAKIYKVIEKAGGIIKE
jgi:hypothetical protein